MMNKIMEKFEGIERIFMWVLDFVVWTIGSNVMYNLLNKFLISRSMTDMCNRNLLTRNIMTNLAGVFLVFAAISVIVTLITYYKSKMVSSKEVES